MLCHACKCHVTPNPPRTMWKIVNLVFWAVSLPIAIAFSLVIGLNIVLAPAAICVGMAVGTSARRFSSWTCPECHEELIEHETFPLEPVATAPLALGRAEV